MEEINIYNANLQQIGVMERELAHLEGHWHITFHCWIVSDIKGGSLLVQLRSHNKKSFPNMFDVSAAGHILANEEVKDGIREIEEELGVTLSAESMYNLGYRVEVHDQENGHKDREYQSVHMVKLNMTLENYEPQIDEVSGLFWINIEDGLKLFNKDVNNIEIDGIAFNMELRKWEKAARIVSISDFIPRIQNYYLTICIMSKRLLNREFPISIS